MRLNPLLLASLLPLLAACAPAGQAPSGIPALATETYRLPNGLTVILHEDHRLPLAAVNLWYHVGAKDELAGRSGFAHLFEHLMFMGTERVPEFWKAIDRLGAVNNATTSPDRTNYFETGPARHLPVFLWLEADRMEALGASMTQEKLDRQRDIVRNERREHENAPYGKVEMRAPQFLYPAGHPYHLPTIGTHEDLEKATVEDVTRFFATFYVPNNASLVVAGDFDPAELKPMIARLFGDIPAGPEPAHRDAAPVVLGGLQRQTLRDSVQLPRLSFVWHSPAWQAPGDAEMDLAASALGAGKDSPLYRRLVYEEHLAQAVYVYQQSQKLGSLFRIDVVASPGADLALIERRVDGILAGFRASGPGPEDLSRARNAIETQTVQSLQSLEALADRLNQYQDCFGTPDGMARDLDRYQTATAAGVRDWSRKVLDPDRRLILTVLPEDSARAASGRDARPEDAAERPFAPPLPEVFALPNGLAVWHLDNPALPLVAATLLIPAGSAADAPERAGLASATATMLDEGAGDLSALGFSEALERLSASFSASAGYEVTSLHLQVLKRNLAPALGLFETALRAPRFEEAEWARVQAQRLAALRQVQDDPVDLARRVGARAFFGPGHPYALPGDGLPETVGRLAASDLRGFWRAAYRPAGATLLVAGDIRRADLERLLAGSLGRWQGLAAPALAVPAVPEPPPRHRLLLVDRPGSPQTVVRFVLPGPTYPDPDRVPLEVLNALFGGDFTSRLNLNLRERHGYTYSVGSGFQMLKRDGCFIATGSVQTEVTGKALQEFLAEFGAIRKGGIRPEELPPALSALKAAPVQAFQTLEGALQAYLPLAVYGRPPQALREDLRRLDAVEAGALDLLAERRLRLEEGILVLVGDREKILPQLEGLGLPEPETVAP